MPNYQNGKIYSIRSSSCPDLVYVGSTVRPLSERMSKHRSGTKPCTSQQILELGDAYIELIENYPCSSVEELRRREGEIQRSIDCVNRYIAGRRLEYYQENADQVKKQSREYYHDHRERALIQKKIYTLNHREEKRRYDQENKEIQVCLCGVSYNYGNTNDRNKHYHSRKHQNHVQLFHERLRGLQSSS